MRKLLKVMAKFMRFFIVMVHCCIFIFKLIKMYISNKYAIFKVNHTSIKINFKKRGMYPLIELTNINMYKNAKYAKISNGVKWQEVKSPLTKS